MVTVSATIKGRVHHNAVKGREVCRVQGQKIALDHVRETMENAQLVRKAGLDFNACDFGACITGGFASAALPALGSRTRWPGWISARSITFWRCPRR
jgi:hypothetical protein